MWSHTDTPSHSFRGDLQVAQAEESRLEALAGISFVTPSIAVLEGLKAIGNPRRIGVLTPYWPPADAIIAAFFTACGYEVVASHESEINRSHFGGAVHA
jgi:maleate cis-trans isomerase